MNSFSITYAKHDTNGNSLARFTNKETGETFTVQSLGNLPEIYRDSAGFHRVDSSPYILELAAYVEQCGTARQRKVMGDVYPYAVALLHATREDMADEGADTATAETQYIKPTPTAYLRRRVTSEKRYEIDRVGKSRACLDWLQGLGVNVPHYNGETEKFPGDYWHNMASLLALIID